MPGYSAAGLTPTWVSARYCSATRACWRPGNRLLYWVGSASASAAFWFTLDRLCFHSFTTLEAPCVVGGGQRQHAAQHSILRVDNTWHGYCLTQINLQVNFEKNTIKTNVIRQITTRWRLLQMLLLRDKPSMNRRKLIKSNRILGGFGCWPLPHIASQTSAPGHMAGQICPRQERSLRQTLGFDEQIQALLQSEDTQCADEEKIRSKTSDAANTNVFVIRLPLRVLTSPARRR